MGGRLFEMKDKDKVLNHYNKIKNSLDTALEVVKNSNIDDEEGSKLIEKLNKDLSDLNKSFKSDIEVLEKQSEWDKLCIAFFGETNAGKSTLIEALRILYNEQSRMLAMKKSTVEYESALAQNNENYKRVDEKLKDYMAIISDYAEKINRREKKYQTDIIGLQKTIQYYITEFDYKQKKYQETITKLQKTVGLTLEKASKQEEDYKIIIVGLEKNNRKLKILIAVSCFVFVIAGFFLAKSLC